MNDFEKLKVFLEYFGLLEVFEGYVRDQKNCTLGERLRYHDDCEDPPEEYINYSIGWPGTEEGFAFWNNIHILYLLWLGKDIREYGRDFI